MSCVKKEILIGGKEKEDRYACFVEEKKKWGKKDKQKHPTVHAEVVLVVLLRCGLHI